MLVVAAAAAAQICGQVVVPLVLLAVVVVLMFVGCIARRQADAMRGISDAVYGLAKKHSCGRYGLFDSNC